jgi:hypothetical protein
MDLKHRKTPQNLAHPARDWVRYHVKALNVQLSPFEDNHTLACRGRKLCPNNL